MQQQAYPAANTVAARLYGYFARHRQEAARQGQQQLASLPDTAAIESLISAAFWASLRKEEGYVPRISLAFLAPGEGGPALTFERPLSLDPRALSRVAPAVEGRGTHLGVWRHGGRLCVWGTTRSIPAFGFVLEVAQPGLLVVKHHRGDALGKFVNVAVLEGDEIKIVDEHASSLPDCPKLLASLLGFDEPASWANAVNVLVPLAVAMRSHRRGGLLLVIPAGTDAWRQSIIHPILYHVIPPFSALTLMMQQRPQERRQQAWKQALEPTIDMMAGLTAVDGATVLTSVHELLAFGAKITRRPDGRPVEQVTVTEPVEGSLARVVHPTELGGTRHLSAAQFVQDQRDAVALVASQDGRFTVFAWSPHETMVHAHRVETLLM